MRKNNNEYIIVDAKKNYKVEMQRKMELQLHE
jgi:hypothetical protein